MSALVASPAAADFKKPKPMAEESPAARTYNLSDAVVVATVKEISDLSVLESFPEQYVATIHVDVVETIKGHGATGSLKVGIHTLYEGDIPKPGQKMLIGMGKELQNLELQGSDTPVRWVVRMIMEASAANVALARSASKQPVGWVQKGGSAKAPFAGAVGKLAGPHVTLTVAQVAPKQPVKWTNPYGDGLFTITVTNTSNSAVQVPALLSHGGKVLWAESLLYVHRAAPHPMPGAKPIPAGAEPVELKAGASISTTVDMKLIDFEGWAGGAREYFTFALGELSVTSFFYYQSTYHGPMRAEGREALLKR